MKRDSERIYDEFLVSAVRAGDRPALGRLIARWQPRLLRHAWRVLGDSERARDVVQESWLDILKGIGRLDDVAAFPAWAYRIVTRRCQRHFVAAGRTWPTAEHDEAQQQPEAAEQDPGELAAELSLVLQAIARLPAPQRVALALFYLDDLSVAEIAVATDVPPGTVKTRLMHARHNVRAILEGEAS